MTVDLTKLKAGDSVRILDSVLEVEEIVDYRGNSFELTFKNHETKMEYYKDGQYFKNPSIMDILEIIPAPFDWGKVEQGDAFEHRDGKILYFVAHDFLDERFAITAETRNDKKELIVAQFYKRSDLTPRPDIPNAKK